MAARMLPLATARRFDSNLRLCQSEPAGGGMPAAMVRAEPGAPFNNLQRRTMMQEPP